MAVVERTYTIPLKREWLKSVRYKRAKKAVRAIREFLMRHMKVKEIENIKLGRYLNMILWSHGIKNPPPRVKVNAVKDDKGIVRVEMVGAPVEKKKDEKPKRSAGKEGTKTEEKKTGATAPKAEEKKAAPDEAKPEENKPAPKPASAPGQPAPAKQPPALKQQAGQIIR